MCAKNYQKDWLILCSERSYTVRTKDVSVVLGQEIGLFCSSPEGSSTKVCAVSLLQTTEVGLVCKIFISSI